jgi:predicted nucleic acid-binding Zn finger protein
MKTIEKTYKNKEGQFIVVDGEHYKFFAVTGEHPDFFTKTGCARCPFFRGGVCELCDTTKGKHSRCVARPQNTCCAYIHVQYSPIEKLLKKRKKKLPKQSEEDAQICQILLG